MDGVKTFAWLYNIFMIPSFDGWQFYEFTADDGGGVITEWRKAVLGEDDGPVFDALLLNYRHWQQWNDLWEESTFVGFGTILEIWLPHGPTGYKILATRGESIYELVMFAATKGKRVSRALRQLAESRIQSLQQHPRQYREYTIH